MKKFFKSTRNQSLLGGVMILLLCASVGYAVTLPHTFTANTPATAGEVNANFDALKTAVDALETKVSNLGATLPSKKGKLGYALISSKGTIDPSTSFNSSGGAVEAEKKEKGRYIVTFSGLGDSESKGYNIQITADAPLTQVPRICGPISDKLEPSTDIEVKVFCFDDAGNFVDAAFYISVLW